MGKVLPKKREAIGTTPRRKRHNDLILAREVGARMRDLRLALGLSLKQLHARGAPTPSQMSSIERGRVDFKVETIGDIATALGVRPWQLLTDDPLLAFDLGEAKRIMFVLQNFANIKPTRWGER